MKNQKLKYIYNVIGLAVLMFLAIREFVAVLLGRIPFAEGSVVPYILSIAVFLVALLVPTITMENMLGLHPKLFRKVNCALAGSAVAYSYLLIIAAAVANSLVLTLLAKAGLEFHPRFLDIPQGFVPAVLYLVYVCVLPAFLEEIFVRGYMLNALRGYGTTFAVLVTSACFALMHSSLENFIMYFACGILLAQLYITFDSLWPAIALHFVNNSVSFFLNAFRGKANAVSVLGMITLIYTLVIVLGWAGKKYLDKQDVKLHGWFVRGSDVAKKVAFMRYSYAAVAAAALLLFFAVLGSYNNLL